SQTLMRVIKKGKDEVGAATFKLTAPGDITRIRTNLGYRLRAPNEFWQISASFDGGKTFTDIDKVTGPTVGMQKYMIFDKVPAGSREALVRFTGKETWGASCVFALRIDADYKEPAGAFKPVKITYVWDEAGKEKTDVHVAKTPKDSYKIQCGPKTTVKSLTVELDK
ncbi:MAG TPA: hypothetical protein VHP11_17245, partial [Tepidisphaeraceae bacterium]|nr:hypothetical protein [Tepidisphaeraceae bacterium]